MTWLALIRAILSLLNTIGGTLQSRQLLKAGEAQEAARALKEAIDAIDKARAARRDSDRRNADPARVRDDDGFKRD